MRCQQNATELLHVVGSYPASYLGSGIGKVTLSKCHKASSIRHNHNSFLHKDSNLLLVNKLVSDAI